MAKRFRYKIELNLESNSKKETIEELESLIQTLKAKNSFNQHFVGGTAYTNVDGYIKKPKG